MIRSTPIPALRPLAAALITLAVLAAPGANAQGEPAHAPPPREEAAAAQARGDWPGVVAAGRRLLQQPELAAPDRLATLAALVGASVKAHDIASMWAFASQYEQLASSGHTGGAGSAPADGTAAPEAPDARGAAVRATVWQAATRDAASRMLAGDAQAHLELTRLLQRHQAWPALAAQEAHARMLLGSGHAREAQEALASATPGVNGQVDAALASKVAAAAHRERSRRAADLRAARASGKADAMIRSGWRLASSGSPQDASDGLALIDAALARHPKAADSEVGLHRVIALERAGRREQAQQAVIALLGSMRNTDRFREPALLWARTLGVAQDAAASR